MYRCVRGIGEKGNIIKLYLTRHPDIENAYILVEEQRDALVFEKHTCKKTALFLVSLDNSFRESPIFEIPADKE